MSRRSVTATNAICCIGLMGLLGTGTVWSKEICAGDCNHDLTVTVDELILGVRIGLGELSVDACQALDLNGDEQVTIEEIVRAVSFALGDCAPAMTATPTPTATPRGPLSTPAVNPLPEAVGDDRVTLAGRVLIDRDQSSVYVCAATGCVSTGPFTGYGTRSFSLEILLKRDRVNHLFACTLEPECRTTACTEADMQGAPLDVRQVPCLSGPCTPTPSPTPTCSNIFFEFCDGGTRGGTCGACCFCEATATPARSPTPTPSPSVTPTHPVCLPPGCPDLQPAAAQEFLPRPDGGCITDFGEILPYLANACVGNPGDSAAGPFHVDTRSIYATASLPAQGFDVPSLDAGAQLCRLVPLPYSDMVVIVDSDNAVLESDESNNRRTYPLAIPSAPPVCTATPTPLL